MPGGNDAVTYEKTRAHPENIKVRRVLMYQARLVSHPNGRSDKGSLSGGLRRDVIAFSHPGTCTVMSL